MIFVAGYIAALVAFVAADMVWLGIMVEKLYRPAIGDMLSTSVNLPAGGRFLSDLPGRVNYLRGVPGCAESVGGPRRGSWRSLRLFRLCHLRPDQPGDVAQLADAFDRRRPRLGLYARRICRDDRLSRGQPFLDDPRFQRALGKAQEEGRSPLPTGTSESRDGKRVNVTGTQRADDCVQLSRAGAGGHANAILMAPAMIFKSSGSILNVPRRKAWPHETRSRVKDSF